MRAALSTTDLFKEQHFSNVAAYSSHDELLVKRHHKPTSTRRLRVGFRVMISAVCLPFLRKLTMLKTSFMQPCKQAGLAIALAGISLAISTVAFAADRFVPAPPEAGTALPVGQVKFRIPPFPYNTFFLISMQKRWLQDV